MADTTVVSDPGAGGSNFAVDDIAGNVTPYTKLQWGASGTKTHVAAGAGALPIQDGGNSITVDGTVAVTGVATDAKLDTIITHLDGVEGLLTTIDADTGILSGLVLATQADDVVNTSDGLQVSAFGYVFDGTTWDRLRGTSADGMLVNLGANNDVTITSGTITTVTTVSAVTAISNALPAGNNNIGDVDVASVVPGTGATNLGKAEDAAHTTGDVGVGILCVRQNSQVDMAADGDYAFPTIDDSGGIRVSIVAGAGSGGTAAADDADFTAGTTQGTPVQGVYESTPTNVTDGDLGTVGVTQKRHLKVTLFKTDGTEVGYVSANADDAAGATDAGVPMLAVRDDSLTTLTPVDGDYVPLRVSSTGALHVTGGAGGTSSTDDAAFTAASGSGTPMMGFATADSVDSGDVGVIAMTTARAMHVAVQSIAAGNNNIGDVDVASIAAGDNNIGNVDIVTMPNVTLAAGTNTNEVVGDAAIDAAIAGNPVLIGGRASTATPTAMSADNDAQALWLTREGAAVIAGAIVDDAAFTVGTSRVTPVAYLADESSTDSVDEGDVGVPRMTLDRKTITADYAHTAGGGSSYSALSTAAVLNPAVKASPGQVYSIQCFNNGANEVFIRLYNQTTAPATTDGANIIWRGMVPGNAAGAGFTVVFPKGKTFTTGIGARVTGAVADNDATVLAANEVMVNIDYA